VKTMTRFLKNRLFIFVIVAAGAAVFTVALVRATGILWWAPTCRGPGGLPVGGQWSRGASMPEARLEPAFAVLDGRVYVVGGMKAGWLASNMTQIYDPLSDRWETGAPVPVDVHHATLSALGGYLYLVGGYDDMGKMMRAEPDISQGWRYDPDGDTWTRIADMPAPRAAHAMVEINGLLYIVGGTGENARSVWVYDPASDSWDTSRRGLMPTMREHLAAAALDGQIYVVGGRWNNVNTGAFEKYDPASDTWTTLADMPTPRSTMSVAVLNGRIHVVGGEDMVTACTHVAHEVYDPASDTWTALAAMPTSRQGMASVVVGGQWYLIGGSVGSARFANRGLTGLIEIFSPGAGV
jgi:N-acetylneuraminic acid mutarotase